MSLPPDVPAGDSGADIGTLVDEDPVVSGGAVDDAPGRGIGPDADDLVVLEVDPVVLDDGPDGSGDADTAAVDPRMKRRWIDQRRHEGRRRLRIVVGIAGFVLVAGLAWVVAHSALLGAETVTVHGVDRLDPAAVRAAAGIGHGAPLLFLDDAAVAKRVEQLPVVAKATVRTELPHTVVIDVVERRPVAWANASPPEKVALIDEQGLVFARVVDPPDGLLRLGGVTAGAVGTRVPHARALRRIGRLPAGLRLITDHSGLTETGAAVLVLRAGDFGADAVVLGDDTATARKGAVALAVLADLRARGEHRQIVDVSVPEAPVVR